MVLNSSSMTYGLLQLLLQSFQYVSREQFLHVPKLYQELNRKANLSLRRSNYAPVASALGNRKFSQIIKKYVYRTGALTS